MKINNLDTDRLLRFFNGNYSSEDRKFLREIFNDRGMEDDLEHYFRRHWYEILGETELSQKNLDHILYRIHFELNTAEKDFKKLTLRNIIIWSSRVAAILMLPLLVWLGLSNYRVLNAGNTSRIEIKAPAFARAQFSLPDGTVGWLNCGSSLKYRGDFMKDRKVTLNGEAFFDVQKNPERPFIVSTTEFDVTVLGTKFNIASYENENKVEVVLDEGKMILNNKESNKSYTMNPNDLIVYDKTNKELSIEEVQTNKYLSWVEGKLIFRNDPLDVVAGRLERWYNVEVEIMGSISDKSRLRATFIDENLDEILYYLKRSLSIDYRIEEGSIGDDGIYMKKKVLIMEKLK